ncbi:MAG: radical SAM protein [Anaerolineae bacterium]|nr:radical SAM protein [Anaerolineae bacterium]
MCGEGRKSGKGQVLLVNPWIYDFAAHNLWIEPLGLLTIASVLRDSGYAVTVLDCLAPHPGAPAARGDGSGKFLKTVLERPASVAAVPRRFGRYGWPLERFDAALEEVRQPDAVLVTAGMTYWYPGVFEVIRRVRTRYGRVPVALGGVYASLCTEHAQEDAGADLVVAGPGVAAALRLVDDVTGHHSEPDRYTDPRAWPAPAHHLVSRPFAGIVASWGCPYRCTYCASHRLQPAFVRREAAAVVEEIAGCVRRGIQDFAFYDDALLAGHGRHLAAILRGIMSRGLDVRFHTPNGMHARGITPDLAKLMRGAGVVTVRLSLETVEPGRQRTTGGKVTTDDFARAVSLLHSAGYTSDALGAYILAGLPSQPLSEVEDTVNYVHGLGVQAKLALFSPIPGTPDGDRVLPVDADPLLHNNTVHPYLQGGGYLHELQRIKQVAKEGNISLFREL